MLIIHAITKNMHEVNDAMNSIVSPLNAYFLECGFLSALVSAVESSNADGSAGNVFDDPEKVRVLALAHNELLVKLNSTVDLVPVRLGALHSDKASVLALVAAQESVFKSVLERIDGAVEIIVDLTAVEKIIMPAPDQATHSGRDYLRLRQAQKSIQKLARSNAGAFVSHIIDEIGGLAREHRADSNQRVSFLVSRNQIDQFVGIISSLENIALTNGVAIFATGPWPTYNFAGAPS